MTAAPAPIQRGQFVPGGGVVGIGVGGAVVMAVHVGDGGVSAAVAPVAVHVSVGVVVEKPLLQVRPQVLEPETDDIVVAVHVAALRIVGIVQVTGVHWGFAGVSAAVAPPLEACVHVSVWVVVEKPLLQVRPQVLEPEADDIVVAVHVAALGMVGTTQFTAVHWGVVVGVIVPVEPLTEHVSVPVVVEKPLLQVTVQAVVSAVQVPPRTPLVGAVGVVQVAPSATTARRDTATRMCTDAMVVERSFA